MRIAFVAMLAVLTLAGCSRHTPPVGRWEGTYDTAEAMIAARVEIDSSGLVRIAGPNAEDVGDAEDDRAAMRLNLAAGLGSAWDTIEPRKMDFDGEVFRKPGGIAPQMIWNKNNGVMYVVIYPGKKSGIKVKLHKVDDFSENPWPA